MGGCLASTSPTEGGPVTPLHHDAVGFRRAVELPDYVDLGTLTGFLDNHCDLSSLDERNISVPMNKPSAAGKNEFAAANQELMHLMETSL